MNIKKISKETIKNLIAILLLIIIYWSLFLYFASHDIVAKLFAPGEHLSRLVIVSATFFIVLRFFIIVVCPGLLLAWAGLTIYDWIVGKMEKR